MPPAFEVLLLNTAIPQIQAAQSGDTYLVPRDIAFSAALTLSAGTANGVPYLNASKVLTTGSALTFDGTNLQVGGNSQPIIRAVSSSTNNATARLFTDGDTVYMGSLNTSTTGGSVPVVFQIGGSEQMRLTSTGLGIGTSSPNAKLDVNGITQSRGNIYGGVANTVSNIIAYANVATGGAGTSQFLFGNTSSDSRGYFSYSHASDTLLIGTAGATQATLSASGNLGLGVTPSGWGGGTKALQFSSGYVMGVGSGSLFYMGANNYYDGSNYRYVNTAEASQYSQVSGTHNWLTAPSGTANSAVVAASKSYTVVALGTTTLAEWQASFSGLSAIPTLGQVLTSLSSPVSPIPNGGLVTQNISFTQAMTLDASGNLGVGTTLLNVGAYGKALTLAATASAYAGLEISGTTGGAIDFQTSQSTRQVQLLGNSNGFLVYTNGGSGLTERARITSGGYFKASDNGTYLNATGAFHELRNSANEATVAITNTNASLNSQVIYVNTTIAAGTGFDFMRAYANSVQQFQMRGDGNLYNTNGTYGTISDQKLKQDIVDAGSHWDDIKAIRFRKYRMKAQVEDNPNAPALLGVIAQELEQVSPGLVDEHPDMETVEVTDEDGNVTQTQQPTGTTTKTVKSSILLMKAAVALQEAMARIEKLEAEVAALKGA